MVIGALRIPVRFFHRGEPGRYVELIGDFPSFKRPRPMRETSPGEYQLELELAPGVYRYKLRIDGHAWITDPRAIAIDRAEGFENSIVIVAGSHPPLYFAPDRRHVLRE